MMRVFHRDRSGLKTMLGRERDEFRGVVVGYQEWAGQPRRGREKPVMVERVNAYRRASLPACQKQCMVDR